MILAWLLSCEPDVPPPVLPPLVGETRVTQLGRYEVALTLEPDPPPIGELFTVVTTVRTQDGFPVEDGKVKVDGWMPDHNHGMQTDPRNDAGVCDAAGVCVHKGGIYRAEGFKFHMDGRWSIRVNLEGPRGPDSTSFERDVAPGGK